MTGGTRRAPRHRHLGDPADCWRLLLLGALLRVIDRPAVVRDDPPVLLARTGRWESGLAKLHPALDDVLGDTAFALAYRWASAENGARTWPGALLVARKATDQAILPETIDALARGSSGGWTIAEGAPPPGARGWTLLVAKQPKHLTIHVDGAPVADWSEVDRLADIASAWLGIDWRNASG